MLPDVEQLKAWVGETETLTDQISMAPIAAMAATLDRADLVVNEQLEVPPLWHWLYCLPLHRQSELGADGHAKRGGFLPPVPLQRRMWVGGRVHFHKPLRVGDEVTRVSRIMNVSAKQGRSGQLVFVRVSHEIRNDRGAVITEEQDLVYRDAARPRGAIPISQAVHESVVWSRDVVPDAVLLFRYSALTFNSHRIHYDRPYAIGVEGYPGLVVHGPLIATLLLELLHRNIPSVRLASFSFRAVSPLFDTTTFRICGRPTEEAGEARLWALNERGGLAMEATAGFDAHR